jgi:hypothetical protein
MFSTFVTGKFPVYVRRKKEEEEHGLAGGGGPSRP